MAKFITFLGLLFAVYGVQGTSYQELYEFANEKVAEYFENEIDPSLAELEGVVVKAYYITELVQARLNSSWSEMVEEFDAKVDALTNGTSADVSSCVSAYSSEKAEASEILANTTSCVNVKKNTVTEVYSTVKADITSFVSDLEEETTSTWSCSSSNIWTMWKCVKSYISSLETEIQSTYSTVTSQVTSFEDTYSDFGSSLEDCGVTTVEATVSTRLTEAYNTLENCIADL
ncbi:uncharacterized protein LOC107223624 [Neodiprion lecontei]|uniref:Uncharacterized protein LOC107223624 n=1 Tax=Neodiprion lecontei TaxID=441921 RepID=A0A6J0BVB9_NEOLC|nr:uncharacterized protein LOC107223624 [Neodiprion lecontei]